MHEKWAVIIVEQDVEDVTVHIYDSEEIACEMMHKAWKRDMATEVVESARKVDFTKSHCLESYAELWYVIGGTPIKYFVQDVTNIQDINETIKKSTLNLGEIQLHIGDKLLSIEWNEPVWTKNTISKENVEIIAIGEDFIGVMDRNGYANEISINRIINVKKGE